MLYRIDHNSKPRPQDTGKILVSKWTGNFLFSPVDSFAPRDVVPDAAHQSLEEVFSTGSTVFLLYEGAKTNNHGALLPTEELVRDIMVCYMKQKINVFVCNIRYSLDGYAHAANVYRSPVLHFLKLLLNTSMSVKANLSQLTEASLNLRTSFLPSLAALFVEDKTTSYMSRRSHKDFVDFLAFYRQTSRGDYSKQKE